MGLLRGATDGQRAPRPPPCVGEGLQGPVLPLPHHARLRGAEEGGLGHPRAARRGRGRKAARPHGQEPDRRRGGHRRVHPAVPPVGTELRRRVEGPDRADRLLDRHRRGLLDVLTRVCGVGVVEPEEPLRPGTALRGHQGGPVLPEVWNGAVQPRARTARRLSGRGRRVGLCPLPPEGRRRAGRGAPGQSRCRHFGRPLAHRLDDNTVDPVVEHRGGGRSRPRLRRGRGRHRRLRPGRPGLR